VLSQPVEQNVTPVPIRPQEKSLLVTGKEVTKPPTPTPVAATEDTISAPNVAERSASKPSFGRPTAQIWIGNPPTDEIPSMFRPPHREKIKDTSVHKAMDPHSKYAIVYFNSVDDASAAIETLEHPKVKFGNEYFKPSRGGAGGGGFSSRGFNQGSYDSRKSTGSDPEGRSFGRLPRSGGRGSIRGGGSGSFSPRGNGSPAPVRGGSSRGRGGYQQQQQREVVADTKTWSEKPDQEPSWPSEEKSPTVPSEDHKSEDHKSGTNVTTTITSGISSTISEST